ncbi:MAG: ATP-binding protein [Chitinispirillaceae bacterium]|nr:ATP-binding protein [Chitinispirillaceae bacterium]
MAKTEDHNGKEIFPQCRKISIPFSVNVRFPGDLDYIPAVRKFVSELLQVSDFSPKFAYRSEIIVDEICNNAVTYGCQTDDAHIELLNKIFDDRIEFTIRDQGGTNNNLRRLKTAVKSGSSGKKKQTKPGLGLEIVRMLSERLDVVIDEKNLTSVHVVRKREDERGDVTLSN